MSCASQEPLTETSLYYSGWFMKLASLQFSAPFRGRYSSYPLLHNTITTYLTLERCLVAVATFRSFLTEEPPPSLQERMPHLTASKYVARYLRDTQSQSIAWRIYWLAENALKQSRIFKRCKCYSVESQNCAVLWEGLLPKISLQRKWYKTSSCF